MNCVLESVFVEIVQPNNEKNVILGCLYKPPNVQTEIFNDEIKQVLAKIGFENKLCFLFGDFNINILNADSHVPTNDFIDLMYSNGFYPLISKPTRITSHSATLIDNISPMTLTTTNLAVSSGLTFLITYLYISDH